MILKTQNLGKKYYRKEALKNVNLELETGKVYGIFGPNGSGKTTLMKIISGLISQTSGEVLFQGKKIVTTSKKDIAYMPTSAYLYEGMTIRDAAKYTDLLYGKFNQKKFSEYLEFFELNEKDKVKALSTGMLGRLKLILTLSRDAKFYMFDEPLNGIDPVSRGKIREALIEATKEDRTFLIASHMVYELESMVDEVIFVKSGDIVEKNEADFLREEHKCSIEEYYKEVFSRD